MRKGEVQRRKIEKMSNKIVRKRRELEGMQVYVVVVEEESNKVEIWRIHSSVAQRN